MLLLLYETEAASLSEAHEREIATLQQDYETKLHARAKFSERFERLVRCQRADAVRKGRRARNLIILLALTQIAMICCCCILRAKINPEPKRPRKAVSILQRLSRTWRMQNVERSMVGVTE
jgi:hypothetical protein